MEIQSSGKPVESLLEKVLAMNILSSDYFKELFRLKTYHEVIDEIYNHVDHVEPWMTGNCRGPSTAFCLLYKFFTMKLTVKQVHGLLKHPDSPYIRAIGFLYVRLVADPKTLWSWCGTYVKDEEEFSPGSNGRMTTMGVYVRDLLLGQYYFDTLFPRVPVPIVRQIVSNLEKMKLPTKHSGVTGEADRRGSEDASARRPPSVKASLSVSFGQRAPHRASTRDSSPVRRIMHAPSDPIRHRSRSREDYDRNQRREDSDRLDRDRDRDRARERRQEREGDREREKYRRHSSYHRHYRGESHNSRYSHKDTSRQDADEYRESRSGESGSRIRSRGLHDQRSRSPSKDLSKDRNASTSSNLAKLKDLYGVNDTQSNGAEERFPRDSASEEVIRLGRSSWK